MGKIKIERRITLKTFFFFIDNHFLKSDSNSVWGTLESELQKQEVNYKAEPIHNDRQIEYILKKELNNAALELKDNLVVVSVGSSTFFLEVLTKLRKISTQQIPIAFILINEKNNFASKIGVSSNPLIALKQILNSVHPISYNLGSVENSLNTDEQIFTDELIVGFRAYVTSLIKNSKFYKLLFKYHLSLVAEFCAMTEAFINQESFSVTTRLSQKYNFFKNSFSICIKNHPFLDNENTEEANNLQLEIITSLNPLSYWFILPAKKFNLSSKIPFIHNFEQKQIHLVINSLEFSQIDNRQLINKFYDAHLKSFTYPFWFDVDSVSLSEKNDSF
ncbi:transcription regulator [Liquorilactobacillus mali]|uniref:Transcription regulator n=1 Tax=Liquorilactobacillus mali TaxID=1618 RepID=A0A0R2G1A2_9LACO|nr:transcription regulator [Liquorilactobacillus mali]